MKILLSVCFCFLFSISPALAQSQPTEVNRIKQLTTLIQNNLSKYDTATIDLWESTEGGEAIGYYNAGKLLCIAAVYYGEMGKTTTAYYFENGKLIQAIQTDESYNRPIYYDKQRAAESNDKETFDPSKSKTETTSYYFLNEKLILLLDKNNKEVTDAIASNSVAGADVVEDAHRLQQQIAKK